jgi:hypothetical protein
MAGVKRPLFEPFYFRFGSEAEFQTEALLTVHAERRRQAILQK